MKINSKALFKNLRNFITARKAPDKQQVGDASYRVSTVPLKLNFADPGCPDDLIEKKLTLVQIGNQMAILHRSEGSLKDEQASHIISIARKTGMLQIIAFDWGNRVGVADKVSTADEVKASFYSENNASARMAIMGFEEMRPRPPTSPRLVVDNKGGPTGAA